MKKLLTILLAALLLLSAAACTNDQDPAETAPAETVQPPAQTSASAEGPKATEEPKAEFKTLGDIWDFESPGYGMEGDQYARVFLADGVYYRAEALIPQEVSEKLDAIDFFDEAREQKEKALLTDLPILKIYNLSEVMLSQSDLNALAGKTGQDLLDMGFVPQGSYGFNETEKISWASLDKGPFTYQVDFTEYVSVDDNPNVAEVIRPLTVKAVAWEGNLSQYATAADFDINGSPSLADYEAMFEAPERVFYPIPEIPLEDSPFKTLADVYAVINQTDDEGGTPAYSYGMSDALFAAAFEADGACYRVEAEIPSDISAQLDAIDFFDEKRDEKYEALLSPLPVTRVGDLSACRLTPAELDALAGKTGQELLDMGFEYGSGYSFWETTQFYMDHGLFSYIVYMNEKVPEMEDYDAVLDELFRPMTVQKAEVDGITQIASDIDLFW